jgi:hypothetical protein
MRPSGDKCTVIELDADEIDPWLRCPPANLAWADRGSAQLTGDPETSRGIRSAGKPTVPSRPFRPRYLAAV